jgi:hypothetical protein
VTLADKRKVIEVLLCAAEIGPLSNQQSALAVAERDPGFVAAHRLRAVLELEYIDAETEMPSYREACTEAAYRLIESSPVLRREWFGAP